MNNAGFTGRITLKYAKYALLAGLLAVTKIHANEIDEELKRASGKTEAAPVEAQTLEAFKQRVAAVLKGQQVADWNAVRFEQRHHPDFDSLREQKDFKQARGYFVINTHAKNDWLLQAPHADSDLHTGKIASRLFLLTAFRAAQWNTVHRDISDMAHTEDTYWQAFAQAFAELYPNGRIIQIHGFDQESRKTETGSDSDMILSAGHDQPPEWLQNTAKCLKEALPFKISLYPAEVNELGGTQNAQGAMLRAMGFDGFMHIEMSKAMRDEMLNNDRTRARFIGCL